MHGTVWDTPSTSSKKEVSFKPETELGYVTSNCMGRAVRQFDKEASPRLGTGVEYVDLFFSRPPFFYKLDWISIQQEYRKHSKVLE